MSGGGMNLSQAELLKVGPISSRHSLRLLPLSKKKKKVRLSQSMSTVYTRP